MRISLLPALPTPAAPASPTVGGSPATEISPASPTEPAPGDQPASEFTAPISTPLALPTPPDVQDTAPLALPPGTVNMADQAGVATRLVIPKLNLDAPIVLAPLRNQTWDVEGLGQSVGHLEGTAPPGANSNIVLAGHVTLAETHGGPGPFYQLSQLAPGDLLIVYQGEQQFEYVVDDFQVVERTDVEVTYPTSMARITLVTCTNWSQNDQVYTNRLIVTGHLNQG